MLYFKEIDTEEKAYWLGFLMADGCIYKGSDKSSYRLQINLSTKDKKCLKKFNEAISSNYEIKDTKVFNKKTQKTYNVSQLKINCTKMCIDLMNLNVVPKKSLICKMPKVKDAFMPHYLRGYFDGDGCIRRDKKNRWSITIVGGINMLNEFQVYFRQHDICSHIYKINHSDALSLEISDKKSVIIFCNLIYDKANVYYERKWQIYKDLEKYLSRQTEVSGQ